MRAQVHSQGLLGEAAGRERWHGNAIEHFEAMPAAGDEHHNTALEKEDPREDRAGAAAASHSPAPAPSSDRVSGTRLWAPGAYARTPEAAGFLRTPTSKLW